MTGVGERVSVWVERVSPSGVGERICLGCASKSDWCWGEALELLGRAVGGAVFDEILVLSRFFLYVHGDCVDFENATNGGVCGGYDGFDLDAIL